MIIAFAHYKPDDASALSQLRLQPANVAVSLGNGRVNMVECLICEPEVGKCTLDVSVKDLISQRFVAVTASGGRILSNQILRNPDSMAQCYGLNA